MRREIRRTFTGHVIARLTARSLDIGNLAVDKGHFEVPVDVDLLSAEVHNFLRLVQSGDHLVGALAELDGLRLGLLLLLCRWLASLRSTLRLLPSLALRITIVITADGKHLSDGVFHRRRVGGL